MDGVACSVQCPDHLYVLAFELFGFVLIVEVKARARLLVNEQGILAILSFDNLASESAAFLLARLLLLRGRLLGLGLCAHRGNKGREPHGKSQCQQA